MIRVLIVADVRCRRESLAQTLDVDDSLELLVASPDDAVRLGPHADVAVIDLPPIQGRSLAAILRRDTPTLRLIALGVPEDESEWLAWVEAGVVGYATPDDPLDVVRAAIFGVSRGEARCSPRMVDALLRRLSAFAAARGNGAPTTLTRREAEVADLLAAGLSNKEIARRLSIEVATVKNHVHSILGKLEVTRRAQAAARLAGNGRDPRM